MSRSQTLLAMVICIAPLAAGAQTASRRVAVTFDDLPTAGIASDAIAAHREMTLDLLSALTERDVPTIGFVNEAKLSAGGHLRDERVDLLQLWLAAGFDLGNHSYSHPDLHRVSLEEYEADVLRGEAVTRELLAEWTRQPRYFRHPFLHTGTDLATRKAFETFLGEHGYRVAPVTIDNSEWIFAHAYSLAIKGNDTVLAGRIGSDYVEYMLQMFTFYEDQSQQLFGRNIAHVLLVHANQLNAQWFGALADRLGALGYEFITLEAALRDPAYASADAYTGPGGITWLHRWAITRNVDPAMFAGEPQTPAYILKLTELPEHGYSTH